MKKTVNIMWFRRDLRLHDNAALYHALRGDHPVLPLFVFDPHILDELGNKADRRVTFIYEALEEMNNALHAMGSGLEVHHDTPLNVFTHLLDTYTIAQVFTNHDYEPYAITRDEQVAQRLQSSGVGFHTYKDQVIFEKDEVVKDDGTPYTVFTPYAKKWRSRVNDFYLRSYPTEKYFSQWFQQQPRPMPTLGQMGFERAGETFPPKEPADSILRHYAAQRDYPALAQGTSRVGVHLRFGTVSIRELARRACDVSATYLNELIWREFYQMILWHFPRVGQGQSFKPAYDQIQWRNDERDFKKWCDGMTGYPIVDAGMRELNATGFMHNRVRMITASFLSKHLLIDWRWGEAYFAQKLLDFDLASNNGGWQWAAGSGCDAAPYFRVFNPRLQTEKFDKDLAYIRKWVPELNELSYPAPMVVHEVARERALAAYKKALTPA